MKEDIIVDLILEKIKANLKEIDIINKKLKEKEVKS